jgi:HAD superfamily hydrolase (TIGR01509 family)
VFAAVFLDLDDTLFDRGAAFVRYARTYLEEDDPDELAWLAAADRRGVRSRLDFARDVIERRGMPWEPGDYADAFSLALAGCVEPEPGVREAVVELARRARVAVVTNGGSAPQRAKLERIGLSDVVHAVFVSEEIGVAKPSRAIFERALAWSERAAGECMFVGDDPWLDVAPAAALGMTTAWRARGAWPAGVAPAHYTIRSIDEVVALCA